MASSSIRHRRQWRRTWKWKRYFFRFFIFFVLGFLVGLSLLADLHEASSDLKPHHVFFDSKIMNGNYQPHRNLGADDFRPNIEIMDMDNADPFPKMEKEKLVIVVTPTYNRALQGYYMTRLGQTLRLVPPPLLWIVVEMESASMETADLLRRSGVMYRHLVCCLDNHNKEKDSTTEDIKDRGVHQRNSALDHIQSHHLHGIVYFADDDNIYSLHLFHRLRNNIRKVGTWPVAMLSQSKNKQSKNKATLEGPVCNGSQVIGWHTNEKSKRLRRFHVDMSGFAFNSTILWDPKRWQRPTSGVIRQLDTVKEGFQVLPHFI